MIRNCPIKFYFNTMNSFRVMGHGTFRPILPPPPLGLVAPLEKPGPVRVNLTTTMVMKKLKCPFKLLLKLRVCYNVAC